MLRVLVLKELLESIKTYKALALCIIFAIIGLASPFTAKMMPNIIELIISNMPGAVFEIPPPSVQDAYLQFHKNCYQLGLILIILLTMGTMVGEKTGQTIIMVVTKPIARSSIILAKFLSFAILIVISQLVAFGLCTLYTYLLFKKILFIPSLTAAALISGDYLVVLALVILLSTVAPSVVFCALSAIAVYFATSAIGFIVQSRAIIVPGHNSALANFLITGGREPLEVLPAFGVSAGVVAVLLLIAISIFQKQEL